MSSRFLSAVCGFGICYGINAASYFAVAVLFLILGWLLVAKDLEF